MFGAIEQGQEEAVKFYQAWKAEVVLDIYSRYLIFEHIFQPFHGHFKREAQVVKEVPADRLLIWQVKWSLNI